ncbi:PWI domain-containing protein [Phytophthora cinnamomi]|uniref:PWI domain-containing protein n=1 Tax=Phytophthora cinnamomi TaxID=4785 RepID=UPI00355A8854|nr:PWI domain-containing protein [Phytophthora cinnamomi]
MAIRGTSAAQDGRYVAQEKRLLAKMSFPKCFEQRVDMRKVQREVVNQWVAERLTQLLGFEDDIVVAMAINLLEPKVDEKLDPRQLQMALTGFLEKQAAAFTEELWQLLLSAQSHPTGIPSAILDRKKLEMQSIASEKDRLKKVLEAKRAAVDGHKAENKRGRPRDDPTAATSTPTAAATDASGDKAERRSPQRGNRREDTRRRSRSLQRRPRSPPRRITVSIAGATARPTPRAQGEVAKTGKQWPPLASLTVIFVFGISRSLFVFVTLSFAPPPLD